MKLSFKIEKNQSEEILEIPEVALRKALINAVTHRNYFEEVASINFARAIAAVRLMDWIVKIQVKNILK